MDDEQIKIVKPKPPKKATKRPGIERNFGPMTKEQLSAYGRMGGKKSGEARARKRKERETARTVIETLLEMKITNSKGEEATTRYAMIAKQVQRALSGDFKAFEYLFELAGEGPSSNAQEVNVNVNGGAPPVVLRFYNAGDDGCGPDGESGNDAGAKTK